MTEPVPQSPVDPERLNAIWRAVVGKMKEVVREQRITQDELHVAGDFCNRLGQAGMCRSLIDVALAMTSVDALDVAAGGTRPNLEGPYRAKHPLRPDGVLFGRPPPPDAPRLTLSGRVLDAGSGEPVPGAELDFWQADSEGLYDRKGANLRGVVFADEAGRYRVETVAPNDYSEHDRDPIGELFRAMGRTNTRAAHLHVIVSTGGKRRLTTQLFMPTSDFLDRDYVEGAVSEDLILSFTEQGSTDDGAPCYAAEFDFVLAPEAV